MHNELVSYVQSNHAADGIEVRAVGPRAVTLAFPPELHDLGNLIGELEMRFNARVDIVAGDQPGIGPTATVWVRNDGDAREEASQADSADDNACADSPPSDDKAESGAESSAARTNPGIFNSLGMHKCKAGAAVVTLLTLLAAAFSILNNGTALWKHLEL